MPRINGAWNDLDMQQLQANVTLRFKRGIWYTIHCQEQECAGPHSVATRTAQSGKTVNEEAAET